MVIGDKASVSVATRQAKSQIEWMQAQPAAPRVVESLGLLFGDVGLVKLPLRE